MLIIRERERERERERFRHGAGKETDWVGLFVELINTYAHLFRNIRNAIISFLPEKDVPP
ncbi:hypothetical protein DSECCO2_438760 [anaerobic digester metagenome]